MPQQLCKCASEQYLKVVIFPFFYASWRATGQNWLLHTGIKNHIRCWQEWRYLNVDLLALTKLISIRPPTHPQNGWPIIIYTFSDFSFSYLSLAGAYYSHHCLASSLVEDVNPYLHLFLLLPFSGGKWGLLFSVDLLILIQLMLQLSVPSSIIPPSIITRWVQLILFC